MSDQRTPQADQPVTGGNYVDTARKSAIDAYDSARDSVADAGQRAADGIDEAPLVALAAGIAAGALLAALLPRTDSETRLLRPVSERLGNAAKAATTAAREAGSAKLDELGLTTEKGAETLKSLFQGAGEAARDSAKAALGAARDSAD